MTGAPDAPLTVFTIGHSTRTLDEFVAALDAHGVRTVVDVRSLPGSRHAPQFNADALENGLAAHGIGYRQLRALGGRRRAAPDTVNTGWRNAGFRGYADHMQTPEFAAGIDELVQIAERSPTTVMCAEAVPWRCHRSMIGDALLVRGVEVLDIIGDGPARAETLTSFAQVGGTDIVYPAPDELDELDAN